MNHNKQKQVPHCPHCFSCLYDDLDSYLLVCRYCGEIHPNDAVYVSTSNKQIPCPVVTGEAGYFKGGDMAYVPDDLEFCSEHPNAQVRRIRDMAAWVMNHERVGEHCTYERYECVECGRELKRK